MGAVFDEFQRELAAPRQACAGNPERELIRLFLLALEREELVSVSYRESLMQQRIAAMPLPEDVKELLRHALVWIWKDEEMQTIYIRGAILKLGGTKLRVQALLSQAAGRIGYAAQPMEPCTVFAADCDSRDRDWRVDGQGAEGCQAAFAAGAVSGLLSL